MKSLILAVVMLFGFSCSPPGESRFQEKLNKKDFVYNAMDSTVMLYNSLFSRCSAFHVGEGVYVTAAHCLVESEKPSIVLLEKGDFFEMAVELESDLVADFALVLSRPLAASVQFSSEEPSSGAALATLGFTGVLGELMEVTDDRLVGNCRIAEFNRTCLLVNKDIFAGQSGGPTISLEDGGVVGINSASISFEIKNSPTGQLRSLGAIIPTISIRDKVNEYVKKAKLPK